MHSIYSSLKSLRSTFYSS